MSLHIFIESIYMMYNYNVITYIYTKFIHNIITYIYRRIDIQDRPVVPADNVLYTNAVARSLSVLSCPYQPGHMSDNSHKLTLLFYETQVLLLSLYSIKFWN